MEKNFLFWEWDNGTMGFGIGIWDLGWDWDWDLGLDWDMGYGMGLDGIGMGWDFMDWDLDGKYIQGTTCVNYQCIHNAQYVCRLNIREVLEDLEVEGIIEKSLRAEDTKKDLRNIWRILSNFWLVKILYFLLPPPVSLAKIG